MFRFESTEPPALTQAYVEASRRRGRYGNARELAHEERFVHIIATSFHAKWFRSVRRATKSEDQSGIDAVIDTTIGPLYAQVKSSPSGARYFTRKRRRARIIVVIVRENLSDDEVLAVVKRKLNALFRHIYELRGRRRAHKSAGVQ